ncbi:MAG TPA: ATP-binding protein [Candidatus Methylacidiphilales bacterium]|nr:ATP-binding protein [Candidatus Methylacidiphilales bacterium]
MDNNPVAIAIREVLTAIRQRKRVEEILEMVLSFASDIGKAAHGSIVTIDHNEQKLIITSVRGADWTLEKQMCQLGLGEGLTGHVALTGKPYLCPDTRIDPNYFPLFDNVGCELVVPIIVEERVWGLINLDGHEPEHFDEATLSTVTLLAELASFAIKLRLDLTEQERLQRHLIQSEKLASLGETIAGIAHEINNPLTSILSNAQLLALRRGGPADEASINSIVLEAKRTADLVKNLLAFSRKESKKREVIGVNELIKQAVNLKRYQLKVNNIQLISEPCEISYPVSVTAQQMQQVLLNLLNNAEQAIAKTDHPGIVRVEGGRRGETVYITVTDNGVGIPAHVLPFIFDPFFTTKNLGEGTGLGLSIAHTLIENHGGTISARSEPGNTVFTIELPMARSPKMPAEAKETQPLPVRSAITKAKRMSRVLVVDDETAIVDAICEFLDLQNITTDKANDGGEALQLLSKNRYDAIVSDIRMPGVDGPELYERSVAMDPNYKSRFLFMSGDLVRDSTQGFVSSLNCPCLAKPFALQVLYQNLEPLLNGDNGHGGGNGSSAPPYPGPDLTSSGSLGAKTVRLTRPGEF